MRSKQITLMLQRLSIIEKLTQVFVGNLFSIEVITSNFKYNKTDKIVCICVLCIAHHTVCHLQDFSYK